MTDIDRKPDKIDISEIIGPESDDEGDSSEIVVLDPSTGETMTGRTRMETDASSSALHEDLRKAHAEKDKYHDLWIRARADFENLRKRLDRERDEERARAGSALARDLLPVADNLERALAGMPESDPFRDGIALVHRQFVDSLRKAGLEPIEAVGKPFDPVYHEAVATEPTTGTPPNHVLAEIQRGYLFMGRVLRPSLVRVSVSPGEHQKSRGSSKPESVGGSGDA